MEYNFDKIKKVANDWTGNYEFYTKVCIFRELDSICEIPLTEKETMILLDVAYEVYTNTDSSYSTDIGIHLGFWVNSFYTDLYDVIFEDYQVLVDDFQEYYNNHTEVY